MKYLLLLPLVALTAACSSTGGGGGGSSAPDIEWPKSTGTIKIKDTIHLRGSKDYGLKTVDGAGLNGDGSQSENQEAPFYLYSGARLKNVIGKNWPESVTIREGNVEIDGLYLKKTGEDAISTYKGHSCKNLTFRNMIIGDAKDKMVQINSGASNIKFINCHWVGPYKSGVRLKKGTSNVEFIDCSFRDGLRAVVTDKDGPKPKFTNCKFYNTVDLYRSDKNE